MGRKKNRPEVPAPLERTRQRFERWRETREGRTRIPEPLWKVAVKMAGRYGICQTSKTLRLSYYALKKRVQKTGECLVPASPETSEARFVELTAQRQVSSAECVLELEDAAGAKMRIHLKGPEAPDLVALSRSFWDLDE